MGKFMNHCSQAKERARSTVGSSHVRYSQKISAYKSEWMEAQSGTPLVLISSYEELLYVII